MVFDIAFHNTRLGYHLRPIKDFLVLRRWLEKNKPARFSSYYKTNLLLRDIFQFSLVAKTWHLRDRPVQV